MPPEIPPDDLSASAVGQRLQKIRSFFALSQGEFARQLGLGRERFASYEAGRVRLPTGVALRLCRHFVVSEHWLATGRSVRAEFPNERGRDDRRPLFMSETIVEFGAGHTRSCASVALEPEIATFSAHQEFSRAFIDNLTGLYLRGYLEALGHARLVVLPTDPPELVRHTLNYFTDLWLELLTGVRVTAFFQLLLRYGVELHQAGRVCENSIKEHPEYGLDDYEDVRQELASAMREEIPESWPELCELLQDATATRGEKARLAVAFGVTRQSVNSWLSGKTAPTADMAIRLLNWVREVNATKNKSPGRVRARPEQKTRKSKSTTNEKAKSGRPEG